MAKELLKKTREKFHKGIKRAACEHLGMKSSRYQNYSKGRPVQDWVIVLFIRKYSRRYRPDGLTDTQVVDCLLADYDLQAVKKMLEGGS